MHILKYFQNVVYALLKKYTIVICIKSPTYTKSLFFELNILYFEDVLFNLTKYRLLCHIIT